MTNVASRLARNTDLADRFIYSASETSTTQNVGAEL